MAVAVNRSPSQPWHPWALTAIVMCGLILRFHDLAAQSFWLDELWGLEIAAGHGADHQALPVGRLLMRSPDLTGLAAARPMWRIWTGMDRITGPPGSYLLLRAWIDLFGESESDVRSLSALASVAAVAMLFLAVRPWAGPEPALWAAGLMAVAGPQVRAAQDGRPYAPLVLFGVTALWMVGRIVRLGPTRRRGCALATVLLALLLTHYFAIAAVASVGIYGLWFTTGPTRRQLMLAVVIAGGGFAMVWGPFAVRQLGAMSHTDRAAAFLNEAGPAHVARTLFRLVALPASLLVDRRPIPLAHVLVGGSVYAAGIAISIRRRWPANWALWFLATSVLLAGLDLIRSTRHLEYIRYPLLAAPVVFGAIGLLPSMNRHLGRALAAAAVGFAIWNLPASGNAPNADFRSLGAAVSGSVGPGQPIVFAGPADRYGPQVLYLAVSHYAGPPTGPIVLLESPATPALTGGLPASVWMVADPDVLLAREWLPGYHLATGQSWPAVGSLLRMTRNEPVTRSADQSSATP